LTVHGFGGEQLAGPAGILAGRERTSQPSPRGGYENTLHDRPDADGRRKQQEDDEEIERDEGRNENGRQGGRYTPRDARTYGAADKKGLTHSSQSAPIHIAIVIRKALIDTSETTSWTISSILPSRPSNVRTLFSFCSKVNQTAKVS
jgi:hypothetical protein